MNRFFYPLCARQKGKKNRCKNKPMLKSNLKPKLL